MTWLKDLYIDQCGERKTLQFTVGTTILIQDTISLLIRFALAFRTLTYNKINEAVHL